MLVRERMTHNPITIKDDTSLDDALRIMRENKVRRLPILDASGKLVGIVSEKDLLYASPSPATRTSYPSMRRDRCRTWAISSSSSTTSTRGSRERLMRAAC